MAQILSAVQIGTDMSPIDIALSLWNAKSTVQSWIAAFYNKAYSDGYKAAVEQNAPQNTLLGRE